ncbi:SGNH/GDSL hydrolase family protein [Spirosoma rhododendri]|uniref:SGNH/GDSL hydrolase family protein n=1 Tax=Spirosoma rhododendri TaxID=2728024 RepID=A0A7L5DIK5_9BACT|nr:SGNH/GDSL hydrolase family protein [Spirosoma rhododendri]QJD77885.1 SGNH/GDSL hydrolase family protein [Spirosoma rhododendri]
MNQLLRHLRVGTGAIRFGLTYLLYFSFWQFGCAQVEPATTSAAALTDPSCRTITIQRVTTPINTPAPTPQGLPIPSFNQQSGSAAYGSTLKLSASNMPSGAYTEYSYDNGTTWTKGDQVPVVTKKPMLARTRINDLTSQTAQATVTPYFQRMMVIGNSIMSHGPAPNLGWNNFNGMAASALDKDYTHLLQAKLNGLRDNVQLRMVSGGAFERQFGQAGYSVTEFLTPLQEFKPDIVFVRIGENMDEGAVQQNNLAGNLRVLFDFLRQNAGGPVQIICSTSVWNRPQADAVIRQVAAEKGVPLAELKSMVGVPSYFASQYANAGVAAHPNDAGMQRIADIIWDTMP